MTDLFGNIDSEGLYQLAIAVPLQEKIESAIALIRSFESAALARTDKGFYVAFSGGKDSIVLLDLVRRSGVKHESWYNNVTIDPPELVRFIKDFYPEVQWNNPKRHLIKEVVHRSSGLPTRRWRWCCRDYKEQGGNKLFKVIGVRAEESARRKGLWTTVKTLEGSPILCPILYFTEADIWEYIRMNNLDYCSLYDETDENGDKLFSRLGCIGCPMAGKRRAKDFERWPKYGEMWKKAAYDWFEKYNNIMKKDGTPYKMAIIFETPEEYWDWWMETKNVNDTEDADCQAFLW